MGHLKQDFLDIYLTTFLGVSDFKNSQAIKVMFFRKCSEFDVDLKNAHKNWEKVFWFSNKRIWIVSHE